MSGLHALAQALGGVVVAGRVRCPGPGHSARDNSLSVWFSPDGRLHVKSFANDDWRDCVDYVRQRLGLPPFGWSRHSERQVGYHAHADSSINEASARQKARSAAWLWAEAVDPAGSAIEDYLASRGLALPVGRASRTIRFHPACPFGAGRRLPCLIARFSPIVGDLEPVAPPTAIHRIRLDIFGGEGRKLSLGSTKGQCIKLTPDEEVGEALGICEGIETGLAVMRFGFRPVWAVTSTSTMKTLPVLGGIDCLTVFADHDANGAGLTAARECISRWRLADREARVFMPRERGYDWNDAVQS